MATWGSGAGLSTGIKPKQVQTSPLKNAYGSAVNQNAQDYDDIMAGYDSLQQRARSGTNYQPTNYVPQTASQTKYTQGESYSRGQDISDLLGQFGDLSKSGGYSGDDISAIRARALSPLRSAYANAERNVNRQTALQGGYSPNKGALLAKMAREQGELASNATTGVNANIAEMVAAGKLSGMSGLERILAREREMEMGVNSRNANAQREVDMWNANEQSRVNALNSQNQQWTDEFNRQGQNQNNDDELNALQGKANLYGTTPALTNTFANQVLQNNQQNMQANQTANQLKNQRANIGLNLVNQQLGQRRIG